MTATRLFEKEKGVITSGRPEGCTDGSIGASGFHASSTSVQSSNSQSKGEELLQRLTSCH
jgi:hypothetical protein